MTAHCRDGEVLYVRVSVPVDVCVRVCVSIHTILVSFVYFGELVVLLVASVHCTAPMLKRVFVNERTHNDFIISCIAFFRD